MQIDLKLILGIIGNATAMALFLAPTPTFLKIFKMKSTQEFSGLPYVCTLLNCLLWVLYGMPIVKPNGLLILTINGFGVAMEVAYLSAFLLYANRTNKMQMTRYLVAVITLYIAVILTTILALHSLSSRQMVVGSLCVVMAIAMYSAPLSVMGLVIRTRSVEYMPFALSLFNFLNSAVWSAYSLVSKDIFVGIPNGIGCLSGVVQLSLYVMYRHAVPPKVQQGEATKEESKAARAPVNISMEKSLEEIKEPSSLLRSHQNNRPLSNYDVLSAQV